MNESVCLPGPFKILLVEDSDDDVSGAYQSDANAYMTKPMDLQ